ncbi:ubiquitin carboxyl-terminal hydrolase 12-like [Penaeus chinensis]|uniref:ubiquitin carboxyl-terminal hydrolase 12-like n=1 Tax=Penaeus chinensis TaxID=139456 RepID=UPI001FB7166E|nr:ubiquitin carboxyl-terminal hydrolase 12-like [Penaeus chinensis]
MGANASQLEKEIGADQFPPNEHYIGLVNFGNTCYINSVLQALYFCKPFREKILEYKAKNKRTKETLLACLADLFYNIATQKKKVGSIAPKKFIARFRKENVKFDNYMQQDAHEFFVQLIDSINETIMGKRESFYYCLADCLLYIFCLIQGKTISCFPPLFSKCLKEALLVQGMYITSEFVSFQVRSTDEVLNNLSVEVHQNTSITHCLRCFFSTETISAENKVQCENCCSLQEHQKRTRVKKLPTILVLHLKRFQFLGQYNRTLKLSHRVVFPLELRVFDTSSDAVNPDRMYDLAAVVVHCGTGINRGHYIAIVKSHRFWLLFDDDAVDKIDPSVMEEFYGLTSEIQKSSETGYILFYQARDPT